MVYIKKKILKIKAKFKKILFNILKTNPDETRTLLYQSWNIHGFSLCIAIYIDKVFRQQLVKYFKNFF